MGPLGVQEMLGIFVIALLLFGPKKLPELGRMLGKAVSEFRRAKNELKSTFESHLSELEREVQAEKYSASNTDYSSVHYPYQHDEQGQQSENVSSYESAGTNEPEGTSSPHPSFAGTTETQEPETDKGTFSVDSPIPGTVPRSNGHLPAESGALAREEKNSA